MTWVLLEPEAADEPFTGSDWSILKRFLEPQRDQFLRPCARAGRRMALADIRIVGTTTSFAMSRRLFTAHRPWLVMLPLASANILLRLHFAISLVVAKQCKRAPPVHPRIASHVVHYWLISRFTRCIDLIVIGGHLRNEKVRGSSPLSSTL
jgi:hypothetical protein